MKKITSTDSWLFNHIKKTSLKSTRFSLTVTKSHNHKYYSSLKVETALNGDFPEFANFDYRYRRLYFVGVWGVKVNDNLEWGIGGVYRNSLDNNTLFPFFFYNRNFNDRWGIETILPVKIRLRRNL